MRYSVVLPRVEKSDSEAVVRALEQAHLKWECGDQAAALDLVRAASEAALAAGLTERALALTRASAALGRQLEPGTRRPPPSAAAPPRALEKLALAEAPGDTAKHTRRAPLAVSAGDRGTRPAGASAPTRPAPSPSGGATAPGAAQRTGAPHGRGQAGALSPAQPRTSNAPRPGAARAAPTAKPPAASARSAPRADARASHPAPELEELVVTVASSDWETGLQLAVVGRRAARVLVATAPRPDGVLEVRPLAPGEVAPAGSRVALLVSLTE